MAVVARHGYGVFLSARSRATVIVAWWHGCQLRSVS